MDGKNFSPIAWQNKKREKPPIKNEIIVVRLYAENGERKKKRIRFNGWSAPISPSWKIGIPQRICGDQRGREKSFRQVLR